MSSINNDNRFQSTRFNTWEKKQLPQVCGDVLVLNTLSPRSGSVILSQLNPIQKKGHMMGELHQIRTKAIKKMIFPQRFCQYLNFETLWSPYQLCHIFLRYYLLNVNFRNNFQPAITCSKLTIATLEQGVNMFKVNNKDTRATPMASFWCRYC